jgi:hypothetical protein
MNENIKLCSFDIVNMYTNIPITETTNIIHDILDNNIHTPTQTIHELKTLLHTILGQNYVQFDNEYYQQDGLAMGAPTSAIITEIFIQYLEHTKIIETLKKHHIIDYYRYVDDILIVYNAHSTNIDNTNNMIL